MDSKSADLELWMPVNVRMLAAAYPAAWLVLGIVLVVILLKSRRAGDKPALYLLGYALCFIGPILCQASVNLLSVKVPLKYDLYLDRVDRVFGNPSFWIGALLLKHKLTLLVSVIAYNLIGAAQLMVFWAYVAKFPAAALRVAKALVLNLFLAVPFYVLFPAAGPRYAFAGFPLKRPDGLAAHPVPLTAPPNCVPSVHFSSALLVLWFSWRWRWARVPALVYCFLIVLSTLGTGEHYAFDLICAVPYTAGVLAISRMQFHLPASGRRSRPEDELQPDSSIPATSLRQNELGNIPIAERRDPSKAHRLRDSLL